MFLSTVFKALGSGDLAGYLGGSLRVENDGGAKIRVEVDSLDLVHRGGHGARRKTGSCHGVGNSEN